MQRIRSRYEFAATAIGSAPVRLSREARGSNKSFRQSGYTPSTTPETLRWLDPSKTARVPGARNGTEAHSLQNTLCSCRCDPAVTAPQRWASEAPGANKYFRQHASTQSAPNRERYVTTRKFWLAPRNISFGSTPETQRVYPGHGMAQRHIPYRTRCVRVDVIPP